MKRKTLLLNADYAPFDIKGWKWAMAQQFKNREEQKVYVVEYYDDYIKDGRGNEYPIPGVIALKKYVNATSAKAAYSKRNVMFRDRYICQYCSKNLIKNKTFLNIDHVVPRSRWYDLNKKGSPSTFENTVTSCIECNSKKSNQMPQQCKMFPISIPKAISRRDLFIRRMSMEINVPELWEPYLESIR